MLGQSPESHLLLQEKSCKEKYFAHAEDFLHAVLMAGSRHLTVRNGVFSGNKKGLFYLSLT